MKNVAKSLTAALLLVPALSFAGDLSYTYVQGGYTKITLDRFDIDSDGYYVGGSYHIAPNVFVFGSYSSVESDTNFTIEGETFNVGAGLRAPVTDYADFNLAAAFVRAEGSSAFGSSEDDGFSVSTGLRARLTDCFEFNGGFNYADVAEEEFSFDVGGIVHFTGLISATAAYRFGENADAWTAGLRLNF